jgi:hypothetical protein
VKISVKNYKESPYYWDQAGTMLRAFAGKTVEVEKLRYVRKGGGVDFHFQVPREDISCGDYWFLSNNDIEKDMIDNFESALTL